MTDLWVIAFWILAAFVVVVIATVIQGNKEERERKEFLRQFERVHIGTPEKKPEHSRRRPHITAKHRPHLYCEQNGQCVYCKRRLDMDLLEVDHKYPVSKGGTDEVWNLQLLCPRCNRQKGATPDDVYRRRHNIN